MGALPINKEGETRIPLRHREASRRYRGWWRGRQSKHAFVLARQRNSSADSQCSNLVDVFDIIPPERANPSTSAHFAFPSDDGQQARYQTLLTRLSTKEGGPVAKIEWQHQDDEGNSPQEAGTPVKLGKEAGEPLVGNFVDAAAAMR
jgi:hypothetical protein